MKIVRLTAENIKKLRCVEITPEGSIVQITGANGSGKSSVLDSIYYALAGTKNVPSKPVRTGTQKASVKLDLGEVVVTRRFTEDGGTTLVVEGEKGARFPSPQKMLDDLLGTLTFDPLEFSRMDARKQLDTLRGMVKLDVDIDKLDMENAADFAARTLVNREAKTVENQRDAITPAPNLPDKPIDVSALLKEMEKAGEHNLAMVERQSAVDGCRTSEKHMLESAAGQRKQAAALLKNAEQMEAQADRFSKAALKAIGELRPPIDVSEVRKKVEAARAVNVQVELKAKRGALEREAEKLVRQADNLTSAMQDRQERRQQAIASAKMPVKGLSFGDGEILFNKLPFNQASDAEQLRVSVAIAMAANPKLRVLRIKDGSLLDSKSLALIACMAEDKDFQIFIEQVDTTGKVGIYMEDGEVAKVNAAP